MLKIHENPPVLWPQVESIRDFQGQWWVAHTKSRNEKALAHDLVARNVSYFLPMTLKVSRRSHRTLKSMLPLFTGYLFFCGHENDRIELLKTNRVANLLEVTDQRELLRDLLRVEQAVRAGVPLTPHKYIKRGQWCRVIAGPLLGVEGIVVDQKGNTWLVLQVDMLGQAASGEIDIEMIEPIAERRA
ncbi:MAG: transcription termination/antitermination protein NusG [Planctomycetota bacterium]